MKSLLAMAGRASLVFLTLCAGLTLCSGLTQPLWAASDHASIVVFDVDASPTIGTPMAYDPTKKVLVPLRCRGIVLLGKELPVVLCAVDWLGISNATNVEFRQSLASAAGTTPERVAVHTLHQHDAPRCDGSSAEILHAFGREREFYDPDLWKKVISATTEAIRNGLREPLEITHFGVSKAEVEQVASNRRMLDENGKVFATRYTACKDPVLQALPEGVIDHFLRTLVFFQNEKPLVGLTYYATHPQSYYRTGEANPDFPGLARNARQAATGVLHVHFNGAGGNIGAGKYNDGSPPLRQVLADRLEDGMRRSWDALTRVPLTAEEVRWGSESLTLPLASHLNETELLAKIQDPNTGPLQVSLAAEQLAFVRRMKNGDRVPLGCLNLPGVSVLHLPGELFVEYQLAASQLRSNIQVLTAAYGDYGPFYIGTKVAYGQGGYETSPGASNVSPEVEGVLLNAMQRLLNSHESAMTPSDFTAIKKNE